MDPVLASFHPLIAQWFRQRFGAPSDVQAKAWPEVVQGRHVLVTAPTGSGKTLAAFLWSLNQLITGAWTGGTIRVLYLSPLKALNNDVRRNLLTPLAELRSVFSGAGLPFPPVSVMTRSGDTPGEERRRMIRRPPEILITTPESLNILLTSASGRTMLAGIRTVILDEVHAVAANKRGTHLITAVDRLVPLSGEYQRIALSATLHPAEQVADFIGGYQRIGTGKNSRLEKRVVSIIRSEDSKRYEIRVACAPGTCGAGSGGPAWPSLTSSFKDIIVRHHSTLLFTNSRRTAEKVTRLINEGEPAELAYAHHGSLARELRLAVEKKLKEGGLKAIVATNSLELGIDIGSLDQVILVQTPRSVSSSVQRIGRSGHDVGEPSRGVIFPTHGRDFLDAAVMARSILDQDLEEVRPVEAPLDILAQTVLSMTSSERWNIDDLYAFFMTCYPFRNLQRNQFDSVLAMLSGRYADTRLRELKPRVSLDRIDNTVQAHSEVRFLLYSSGGVIPERGYLALRLKDSRARIGELDEEFVWERSPGDTFIFGSRLWRIAKITHNDVEVEPAGAAQGMVPFWRAEEQSRDFHFSCRTAEFLEHVNDRLDSSVLRQELIENNCMEENAADRLIAYLKLQRESTGIDLPHRHHVLIEHVEDPAGSGGLKQVIMHTFWGGRVNRPLALALSQAWPEKEKGELQVMVNDDALLLMLPPDARLPDLLTLVHPGSVEPLLRRRLGQSGFFGARFRENAERALLLPKYGFRRRTPLWLIRRRAKELFAAVLRYDDFPVVLETWRTCLRDEFDLDNLNAVLEEVSDGRIRVSETVTRSASPFAAGLVWKQTNQFMYDDDTPAAPGSAGVRQDLLQEILFSPHLRPRLPAEVIRMLDEKIKRIAPGYSPPSPVELLDWIKDRLVMPEPEWNQMAGAIRRDHGADAQTWLSEHSRKLAWVSWPGTEARLLAAFESIPKILVSFRLLLDDVSLEPVNAGGEQTGIGIRLRAAAERWAIPDDEYDLSLFLSAWLSYYGPLEQDKITRLLGVTTERLEEALEPLIKNNTLIVDRFREESRFPEVCDARNLEILLRMARRFRQPMFSALPAADLSLFLARYQGIVPRGESLDGLRERMESLFGWPGQAEAWEEYVLPARMRDYRSDWLDTLMGDSDLVWFGCGERRVTLAFRQDLPLFRSDETDPSDAAKLDHLIPDHRGRYSFFDIIEFSGLPTSDANELLWKEAWRGNVTNDTFHALRKGAKTKFKAAQFPEVSRWASRRSGFSRWKVSRPVEGHWLRIDEPRREQDLLDEEELVKDRLRQLFRRYGLLFRDILQYELPLLQWRALFRSLRLMELSGEVLSGYFFEGAPAPQFITLEALRMLREPLPSDEIFWINAADPASLCGLSLSLPGLPARVPSTFLVYRGASLVMICRRSCRILEINAEADDKDLQGYFSLFHDLLTRQFNPLHKITIETINHQPALQSPYAPALREFGFHASRAALELWRPYEKPG